MDRETLIKRRAEFLEQSKAHYAADMLLNGMYAYDDAGTFKGCSVGCHLHHIRPEFDAGSIDSLDNKHRIVAEYYGYPEWLALLQDAIFEGLQNGESERWHVQLAETIARLPADYDWQRALHRVHAAILRVAYRTAGAAHGVVQRVIDLHERAARGETVADELWSEARSEALSVARSAARSVARNAAWSAAESAMNAALSATWSAASTALSAMDAIWSAAESGAWQDIRDGVLAALEDK